MFKWPPRDYYDDPWFGPVILGLAVALVLALFIYESVDDPLPSFDTIPPTVYTPMEGGTP